MTAFYQFGYQLYRFALNLASPFHPKARAWVRGRRQLWRDLDSIPTKKRVAWFHAASLGEYEMAKPVIASLKEQVPDLFILVTFFSPSGYEHHQGEGLVDLATYLPHDTAGSAQRFLEKIKPKIAVFVKYEFWPNIMKACLTSKVPITVISANFRDNQFLFRPLGRSLRSLLQQASFIGVQNESSLHVLEQHEFSNMTVTGDSRFDNVSKLAREDYRLEHLEDWFKLRPTIICGSIWKEDEEVLLPQIMRHPYFNFILAPHDVSKGNVDRLIRSLPATAMKWSSRSSSTREEDIRILVLDTIGQLSRVYRYGQIAFVGGGFKTGLHNILEPAVYGLPVLFGPEHQKFWEAKAMIKAGGGFEVHSMEDCNILLRKFSDQAATLQEASKNAADFVQSHGGAAEKTVTALKEVLKA